MTDSNVRQKKPAFGQTEPKHCDGKMTISENYQYVTDIKGNRIAVQMDIHLFEKMLAAYEEFEDIQAYDEAKKQVASEIDRGNFLTLGEYLAERGK